MTGVDAAGPGPTEVSPTGVGPTGAGPAEVAYGRGDDLLPMLWATLDPGELLGRWRNPDRAGRGISEVTFEQRDGRLLVGVTADEPDGPVDWGQAPAGLYTDVSITGGGRGLVDPAAAGRTPHYADLSLTGGGPAAAVTFDHGFLRAHLQLRLNLGVLVAGVFTEFTDDSGRFSYFHRVVLVR